MAPLSIIGLFKFNCKKIHLGVLLAPDILSVLRFTVGEKDEAVGLCGAEVKGDGTHAFGVPLRKADIAWGIFMT
uniref:Uncharacterized protein n=1 Tax=Xenopus tropicalis TaxID=8364 RepID=A0A6I8QHF6_XENTR